MLSDFIINPFDPNETYSFDVIRSFKYKRVYPMEYEYLQYKW